MRSIVMFCLTTLSLFAADLSLTPLSSFGVEAVDHVLIHQHHLYAVNREGRTTIYDIADIQNPTPVGTLAFPITPAERSFFRIADAAIAKNRLVLTSIGGAVAVFALSDPTHPALERRLDLTGDPIHVAVDEQTLALSSYQELRLFNRDESYCSLAAFPQDDAHPVALSGPFLQVGQNLYHIADLTAEDALPQPINSRVLGLTAPLIISDQADGHQLIDLTHPEAPLRRHQFTVTSQTYRIFDGAILGWSHDGLQVHDFRDGEQVLQRFAIPGTSIADYTYADGVIAVTNDKSGFSLYHIDGGGQGFEAAPTGVTEGFQIVGDLLYLAQGSRGLSIFNIAQPGNPQPISHTDLNTYLSHVVVENNILYGAVSYGLITLDVTNPAQPAVLGGWDLNTLEDPVFYAPQAVLLADNLAILSLFGALVVLDVQTPASPVFRSRITEELSMAPARFSWQAPILETGSAVLNPALGFFYPSEGLIAYDLSDPDNPVKTQPTTQLGASSDWLRVGSYYYGVNADGRRANLDVVDLSEQGPVVRKRLSFEANQAASIIGPRVHLAQYQNSLLMSSDTSGLRVIDITQPDDPQLRTTQPLSGVIGAMSVHGNRLFTTDVLTNQLTEYQINTQPARLIIPWVVNNAGFYAKVAVTNTGAEDADVLLTAVDRDGQTRSKEVHIPAGSVFAADAQSLFGELTGYSLTIHTGSEKVHASFLIFNQEAESGGNSPSQTTAQTINDLSNQLVFGYVPGDQTAAVVLTAPKATSNTSVTLSLYDNQQGELAQTQLELTANQPTATLVADLFPNLTIPTHATLVARAPNETPLAGVTFVFNQQRQPSMAAAFAVHPQPMIHLSNQGKPGVVDFTLPTRDHLYTAAQGGGLEVYRMDEEGPTLITRLPLNDEPVHAVELLQPDQLAVLTNEHCILMSLADPAQPQILDQIAVHAPLIMKAVGDLIYLYKDLDFLILNTADHKLQLHKRQLPGIFGQPITAPIPVENRLYSLASFSSIFVWDIQDPAQPSEIAFQQPFEIIHTMAVHNQWLAVGGHSGLQVYDFQDLELLEPLFTLDDEVHWLDFDGDTLWVGLAQSMQSYDLSDPANPTARQTIDLTAEVVKGRITDGKALLAGPEGLEYLDLTTPRTHFPFKHKTGADHTAWSRHNATHKDESCSAEASQPAAFGILDDAPLQWCHQDLTAVLDQDLKIFRIDSQTQTACLLSTIPLDLEGRNRNAPPRIHLEDSRVYTTDGANILSTWDLTDPTQPKRVAQAQMPGDITALQRQDDTIHAVGHVTYIYRDGGAEHLIPWVVANQDFAGRIALFNHSGATASVSLTAVDRNGQSRQRDVTLQGGGAQAWRAQDLFPEMNGYSLRVTSNIGQLYVSFLTFNVTAESGGNSPSQTTAAAAHQLSDQLVFSYLPGNEIAALVLTAGQAQTDPTQQITVHLTLHTATGETAQTDVLLTGNQPLAALVTDLFPQVPADAAVTVQAADGAAIAGVTFVFNQRGQPSMARAVTPR